MRKNIGLKMLAILLLCLSAIGYVVLTNYSYFKGGAGVTTSSRNEIILNNWIVSGDNRYISSEDPRILLDSYMGYVDYVELIGLFPDTVTPRLYYTDGFFEEFTESKAFDVTALHTDDGIRLPIERELYRLRIDLTETPGMPITLQGVQTSSSSLMVEPINLLCFLLFVGGLLMPFFFSMDTINALWINIKGFKRYLYLLENLVRKDITTKYRRSVLGILWSVLNPLLMMLVITAVFQNIFRFQVENFPVYYLTGSLIFNYVSESTSGAMMSILTSASLIRKVYIPKYIFPLEKCAFAFINMLFSFIAVLIIIAILQMRFHWTILLSIVPFFYVFLFSFGFGLILATLNIFFRDTSHLYSVFLTAWMYLTPVIYPVDILPRAILWVVRLNPLYHYVEYFRDLVMYGKLPDWRANAICIIMSLAFLGVGLILFKRNQNRFVLYL